MHLVTYQPLSQDQDAGTQIGVLVDDFVAPLTSLASFYKNPQQWTTKARSLHSGSIPIGSLTLAVPVPSDAKVICVAINYVEHGKEGGLPIPTFPNLFARWACNLSATGATVQVPPTEPEGLDWEVELAAIVGRTLKEVDARRGLEGVLGFTAFNDISGRASQLQSMTLGTGQWGIGKNLDNSGAIGSVIATGDALDLGNLRLTTRVNGEVMQDGTTADMVFSVGELIQFITKTITLNPGDVIATGTPAGVGFGRNPRLYMRPGAVVDVAVEGICSVRTLIAGTSA